MDILPDRDITVVSNVCQNGIVQIALSAPFDMTAMVGYAHSSVGARSFNQIIVRFYLTQDMV